jgi:hypothetical protein
MSGTSGDRVFGDPELIEEIANHVMRWVGPITCVFHESVSSKVHVDLHYVASTEDRPMEVLVTSGMSERPMTGPSGEPVFAEVVAILPAGWPLIGAAGRDKRSSWPAQLLKDLARYPHQNATWLGYGHSMSESTTMSRPYAPNTRLNSVILLPPFSLPPPFHTLEGPKHRHIHFWSAVPLYQEELELKLQEGTEALLDAFEAHGISDRIDPHRTNVALCDWRREVGHPLPHRE